MLSILGKIFIKDYKNINNEKVRTSYGILACVFGIFTNLILVGIKLTLGILFFSISIIADAVNNISDVLTSVLSLIGLKISSKPADKKHPFGHERVENIVSLIIANVIFIVGIELLKESIAKVINPDIFQLSTITIILLGVSILIKLVQGISYLKTSKKINSVTLKANARDSFNDVIATSTILIGFIVSKYINYNLDGILGILVSVFIMVSSVLLLNESAEPLIGVKADKNIIDNIVEDINKYEGVYGTHDVISHTYGPRKIFISLHVEVNAKDDVIKSHNLIDRIEKEIKTKYGVEIVIHMDPILIGNKEYELIKSQVKEILLSIDKNLRYHDLQLEKENYNFVILFDVVIPYESKLDEEELKNTIDKKMKEYSSNYICRINIDKDYDE